MLIVFFSTCWKILNSSRHIHYECFLFTHRLHAQSYSRHVLISQFEAVSSHAFHYLELKEMQIRTLWIKKRTSTTAFTIVCIFIYYRTTRGAKHRELESKCSVSKLVNWQMTYMIFWIMFNVIWFREFCGWLSYLEYEQ